ncbi:MAG TPA: hypothetical protein VM120_16940 [Bryobacteraceae bacterium]|nr:hypothetical protein [Bryobacteraceae bacterium]
MPELAIETDSLPKLRYSRWSRKQVLAVDGVSLPVRRAVLGHFPEEGFLMRRFLPLALVMLTGCGNKPGGKGTVLESSLEQYIPGDTVILAGARIDRLLTTPLYKKLMSEQKVNYLEEFSKKTGLNVQRDLKEFLLASNGKDTLMMARGNIENASTLEGLLEKEGARRVPFGKYTLLAADKGAVVFVNHSIALMGSVPLLRDVLSEKTADDTNRKAVLKKVALLPQDKHIWAVAIGGFAPMPLPETGNLANLARVFQSLETVTMTLDLKDGLSLAAYGLCAKEADARQLHDMLRGLIGFGRLSTPSDKPEMLRFFDSIRVEHTDRTVKLNAEVPMDMVDFFLRMTGPKRNAA